MKLNPASALARLTDNFPRSGTLDWIGLRPAPRAPLISVNHVEVLADHGLVGDHRATRPGSPRQVTLIQAEHLGAVGALLGRAPVDPRLTRRNLVVAGISLWALREHRFDISGVLFQGTGLCEPCSRMEANLGSGGYNAMRGHGGITARVLTGGVIRVGDAVEFRPTPTGEVA
ncbi:MAG: MOSC domain-containing protein [Betaproteobacteria bacterium]|nr:MOSC domain-containing protein [Betaproteobacteria bacterium]